MNKKVIIPILLLLSSCGYHRFSEVDNQLKPYVDEYIELSKPLKFDSKMRLVVLSAGFSEDMLDNVVGVCKSYPDHSREIEIDAIYWSLQSERSKKNLMFHELTHCLCNRGHDHKYGPYRPVEQEYRGADQSWSYLEYEENGYFIDGCPNSLMHPIMVSPMCLSKYWDHYISEMFENCNP